MRRVLGVFSWLSWRADSVPLPTLVVVTVPNSSFENEGAAPWEIYGPTAEVTADDCVQDSSACGLGSMGRAPRMRRLTAWRRRVTR